MSFTSRDLWKSKSHKHDTSTVLKHSQCLQRVLVKTWDTFCLYCLSACCIMKCQSVFFLIFNQDILPKHTLYFKWFIFSNLLILGAWLKQNKTKCHTSKIRSPFLLCHPKCPCLFCNATPILTNQVKDLHRVTNS